jgi:predicted CXXCH cytochrome family protein
MRKALVGLIALAVILTFASAPALAALAGSGHDFTGAAWAPTGGGGKMCGPCHAPHNPPNYTVAPLWNHNIDTTQAYDPYTSPTGTLDATVANPSATSKSRLCLSCHDGINNLDAFGGGAGTTPMGAVPANVGTDLEDDHPFAFTYDSALATADGALVNPAADGDADPDTVGAAAPYLPLFGGELECATCHDAHGEAGNAHFLRMANNTSQLCLKCHTK